MTAPLYLTKSASDKFNSILGEFELELYNTDRSASARYYLSDIRTFGIWLKQRYGSINLKTVTPLDLVEYRSALQEKGHRPSTVNRALISLRLFFSFLLKKKEITDNPAAGIKPVARNTPLSPRWLTRQQQAALMRSVKSKNSLRDETIASLLLHTGIRVGELAALQRKDITIGERSGKITIRKGKGNKYREVPLNKTIRKTLARWLKENPAGPLWPNRYGDPLSSRSIYNIIASSAYHARLPDVTPHTLRHTFCKNALDMKTPIDQVAALAGHSRLDITRKYTAPSEQDLQDAVERLSWE